MVRLPAMNPAQKLNFFLFTSAEGKGAPLPFWGPSQSFGFSLFPLPMSGDLRSLSTNTWSPLRDPHSFLTVTCLTAWYCQFKYGRIVLVLPLRLRGLSRDTILIKSTFLFQIWRLFFFLSLVLWNSKIHKILSSFLIYNSSRCRLLDFAIWLHCISKSPCQIGWVCRIHRLHFCRGVRLQQRVSWYDTKKFVGSCIVGT